MAPPGRRLTRFALIGAGVMGSLHARVVSQNPASELACIVDPDRTAGTSLAYRYDSRWVPDLGDFGPFDAVIVASPTAYHLDWARRALAAGKPLLIEKPVSEQPDQVAAIIEEARRRGLPMMCSFPERYNAAVRTMLQIVEQPLHVLTVRHSPFVQRIPGGVSFDLLIHDVDVLLRMNVGPISRITAQMSFGHPHSPSASEDVVDAGIVFDEGTVAALSASRLSQRKIRRIEVAELDRLVEIDLVRQDITVYRHVGYEPLDDTTGGYRQQTVIDIPVVQGVREPLAAQLDEFLALIHGEADVERELSSILRPHEVVGTVVEMGLGGFIDITSDDRTDFAHQ